LEATTIPGEVEQFFNSIKEQQRFIADHINQLIANEEKTLAEELEALVRSNPELAEHIVKTFHERKGIRSVVSQRLTELLTEVENLEEEDQYDTETEYGTIEYSAIRTQVSEEEDPIASVPHLFNSESEYETFPEDSDTSRIETMTDVRDLGQAVANSLLTTTKVKPFGGQRDTTPTAVGAKEVLNWLEDFEEQAYTMKWNDHDKVDRVPTLLVGPAKEWYKMYIKPRIQIGRTPVWNEFKKQMKTFFLPSSHKDFALRALEARKQKEQETVANYILAKKRLCLESDPTMSETTQVYYCIKGLLPRLKRDVTLQDPTTMDELLKLAKRSELAYEDEAEATMANFNPYMALATEIVPPQSEELLQVKKELEETKKLLYEVTEAVQKQKNANRPYESQKGKTQNRASSPYPRSRTPDRQHRQSAAYQCHYCGGGNHYIADCRKRQYDQRQVTFSNRPHYAPVKQAPIRYPPPKRQIINELVQEMKDYNVIRESHSPWSSRVVIVPKKDGSLRFCIDYRQLNARTKKVAYPLMKIDEALDALEGSRYFSLLDLKKAYWQLEIDEKDKEKTAFVTTDGQWEFNVMPFGLTNAPPMFQKAMDVILSGLKWNQILVYLDDILVFAPSFASMIDRLSLVFDRLIQANLKLRPDKCILFTTSLRYLGHVISKEGIAPDPEKTAAIDRMPLPRSEADARSFVQMASYYRKFLKNFASIAKPLHEAYSQENKTKTFTLSKDAEHAFLTLKTMLTSAEVLMHFNPLLPIQIRTDASGKGLGAILVQQHPEGWKPVAYASRALRKNEEKWAITELECDAVVFALEKFRHYLDGNQFELITDHCPLCYIRNKEKLSPRLHRWVVVFSEFDFVIKHKKGKLNSDADCLSRAPIQDPIPEQDDERLFAFASIDTMELVRQHQQDDPIIAGHSAQIEAGQPLKLIPTTITSKLIFKN
jgi:hypothetical protein